MEKEILSNHLELLKMPKNICPNLPALNDLTILYVTYK